MQAIALYFEFESCDRILDSSQNRAIALYVEIELCDRLYYTIIQAQRFTFQALSFIIRVQNMKFLT
ncbi:MAG: hypothetical protein NHB32_30820 [Fischerella sp. CENA71]|nr:hypothetical protein [Fischerella sp. CENA71]